MNKLFTFLFTMMFLIIGCSGDDPVSGGTDPEPELVGCEAADRVGARAQGRALEVGAARRKRPGAGPGLLLSLTQNLTSRRLSCLRP